MLAYYAGASVYASRSREKLSLQAVSTVGSEDGGEVRLLGRKEFDRRSGALIPNLERRSVDLFPLEFSCRRGM